MKARFIRIAWRSGVIFAVVVILNLAFQRSEKSIAGALIYSTFISILINFQLFIDVASNWRDMLTAKRDLRSWNLLISDYNKKITEEDYLNESKKDWR
jgi:hypothetical protein